MKKSHYTRYMVCIAIVIGFILLYAILKGVSESFVGSVGITGITGAAGVPKQIWTYWDDETTIPSTVKLCMESWKKHNPNYQIQLLTKANYKKFVDIPREIAEHPNMNDMPQRFADLVRCFVIAEKGGVWIDSSTLMGQSLDEWLYPRPAELYGFTIVYGNITNRLPILENWFFAAPPHSPFVKAWRDEFSQLTAFSTNQDYIDSRVRMGVDVTGWSTSPNYLAMHVAAQKILAVDKYPIEKLMLWPAEKGPFRYLVENQWDATKGLRIACNDPSYRAPFMKLRSNERNILESRIATDLSNEKCKWS
jgi:hypothetical protein